MGVKCGKVASDSVGTYCNGLLDRELVGAGMNASGWAIRCYGDAL